MLIPTHTYIHTVLHNTIHMGMSCNFINMLSSTTLLKRSYNLKPVEKCSPTFFSSCFIPKEDTILELRAHSVF